MRAGTNSEAIDGEFLAQFAGRNARSNWETARTLEDLLYVPAKITALRGNHELTESLGKEIKCVLQAASAIHKPGS